jgi:hypothetical protein
MVNLLYPRSIEVHRIKSVAGTADHAVGLTNYSGAEQSTSASDAQGEAVLFTCIPASIQSGDTGRKKGKALPQDVFYAPTWYIFIPPTALARYAVRDRDIIIDDEKYRYEVGQAYWNMAGYKLSSIRLEA